MWQRLRNMGHSRVRAHNIEQAGGEKPLDKLMINYLRRHQIAVPGINT
jgi:hypothetical protein